MKKLLGITIMGASLVALASCNTQNAEKEKSFVSLDINPSVELVVEDGRVTNVYATNDDAKVLIYDEELVGKKFEDVVNELIDLSVECGYLSAENTVVDFTVSSDDESEKYFEIMNFDESTLEFAKLFDQLPQDKKAFILGEMRAFLQAQ